MIKKIIWENLKLLATIPPIIKYISIVCLIMWLFNLLVIDFIYEYLALYSINSADFHFWQPITCTFIHGPPKHILYNLIYFILFGFFIENELNKKWFSFLIITPIIFSFILVQYTWSINGFELPNVGLSSVVYGLTAFFIFLKNRNQSLILLVLKLLAILEIVLVLWDSKNCVFSNCASVDSSDASHLGGILGGTICAIVYYNPFTQNSRVHL